MCKWGDVVLLKPPDRRLIPNRANNDWVKVDSCLAEAVTLLWYFGYPTLGCCCGHGKEFDQVRNEHGSIDVSQRRIWRWWPWACSAPSWLRLRFEEAAR